MVTLTTNISLIDHGCTTVILRETTIQDTQPGPMTVAGCATMASEGASLTAKSCDFSGNTAVSVGAHEAGTSVDLYETTIRDTWPDQSGERGIGIGILNGAILNMESCDVKGSTAVGVVATNSGTSVTLRETTIQDTQPEQDGTLGYGIQIGDGAFLAAETCAVTGNTQTGVIASGLDTQLCLEDSRIASTRRGERTTVGIGVASQRGATITASNIEVTSNEGPGLYVVHQDTLFTCSACTLAGNQFAGTVVLEDASFELIDSIIEGTAIQENIGGGVGIYTDSWMSGPPALSVTDSTIQDNPIAGAWLSGAGSYIITGSAIHGGEGWTREGLTKCGDAVYAHDGVTTWDGSSGLLLQNNELLDGLHAGLILESASATLSGNSYARNAVDLVSQGADCATPPDGYEDESLGTAELCPTYDYATCGDEFMLFLELAEPELGHGAAQARPGPTYPASSPIPKPTQLPMVRYADLLQLRPVRPRPAEGRSRRDAAQSGKSR